MLKHLIDKLLDHHRRYVITKHGMCPDCNEPLHHFNDLGCDYEYCNKCGNNYDGETGNKLRPFDDTQEEE